MTVTLPRSVVEQAINALKEVCGGRCNREYNPCWEYEVADRLSSYLDEAPAEDKPLYTQPQRVALTPAQIDAEYAEHDKAYAFVSSRWSFDAGVQFAEKHHGIGEQQ